MGQSVSEILQALPETASVTLLQDRLKAVGINEDLSALPAAQVSEKFKQLIGDFLTKPIGAISLAQIEALTAVVKEADNSLESYIRKNVSVNPDRFINNLKWIGVDVSVKAPTLNEETPDTDSNNKTSAEKNHNFEDELLDAIEGTKVAIEALCAAKKAGLDFRATDSESGQVKYSLEFWKEHRSRIKAKALDAGLDEETATLLGKLTGGQVFVGWGRSYGWFTIWEDGELTFNIERPRDLSPWYGSRA